MSLTVAQLNADYQDTKQLVKEHDVILVRGNGEPSLREDMRTVKRDVEEIKKYLEDEKKTRQGYMKLFVGIIVAQFLAGLVSAAVLLIRIAPYIEGITS